MTDALESHENIVSIGGKEAPISASADDIDGLAREEEEPTILVERLDKTSTADGMEISAVKTKLMINISDTNKDIKVNGQKF